MANIKIRYLVAKKQKNHVIYYWQPKLELREHGFYTRRLAEKTNLLEDAIIEAERFNKELDEWRKTGQQPNAIKDGTIEWLTKQYQQSMWYKRLSLNTQKGYHQNIVRINKWAGKYRIEALNRRACKVYYSELCKESISSANALMRVMKLIFSFAKEEGIVNDNPVQGVRLLGTKSRHQVWSDEQIDKVVKYCIDNNRKSVAVAIILARDLSQRQEDILRMKWEQYDGVYIRLKQGKTGKELMLECTSRVIKMLDSMDKVGHIVINESTKKPYNKYTFRHLVSEMITGAGIEDSQFTCTIGKNGKGWYGMLCEGGSYADDLTVYPTHWMPLPQPPKE